MNSIETLLLEPTEEWLKNLRQQGWEDIATARNVIRCRLLANTLIEEDGNLNLPLLQQLIPLFKERLYATVRSADGVRDRRILAVLELLQADRSFQAKLKQIVKPYANPLSEEVIRETVGLELGKPVTDAHARRAVLAAWLTTLRQAIGSCFATAPAILVQEEQPVRFLQDLDELLATGQLKRTFGGIEYTAPMSLSGGNVPSAFKGIAYCSLLRRWEYTFASFAESKPAFTRWNLYASLGLQSDEPGGIGEALFAVVREQFEQAKLELEAVQNQLQHQHAAVQMTEHRFRTATEQEARWLRMEYQTKMGEVRSLQEQQDLLAKRCQKLGNLYPTLIEKLDQLFPQYFQEVYDADLRDVGQEFYDDAPAGFRLVYKHGRSIASQWTRLMGPDDFVGALKDFFIAIEGELTHDPDFQGLERDLTAIVTAAVLRVRSPEFLSSALNRMAAAHGLAPLPDPVAQLDLLPKKPWVYRSGGTMTNLIGCYFGLSEPAQEVSRWMESPIELLVYLLDVLKTLPDKQAELFLKDPEKRMLVHSPTHAFSLKPGWRPFVEGWYRNNAFTYTWVRDEWVLPRKDFVDHIVLTQDKMRFLSDRLAEVGALFSYPFGTMSPPEFRRTIVDAIGNDAAPLVDAFLMRMLPLSDREEALRRVVDILKRIDPTLKPTISLPESPFIGADQVRAAALQAVSNPTGTSIDWQSAILKSAQELGYALPAPILFADTNWAQDAFGFTINPGTGEWELCRFDFLGAAGLPMAEWKQWLDGTRREPTWGIYPRINEYAT